MAAGQYPGFQYGGAFGGASTGSIPAATGVQGAYGGETMQYSGGEYAAAGMPEPLWWFGHSLSYTSFGFGWTGDCAAGAGQVTVLLASLAKVNY